VVALNAIKGKEIKFLLVVDPKRYVPVIPILMAIIARHFILLSVA